MSDNSRSGSLNRTDDRSERRASVTKVVMVKDKRAGSLTNINSQNIDLNINQSDSSKRYSITKILPVRSKMSQGEIQITASDFQTRSRSSEERFTRKKTSISEIQTVINQKQDLESLRKFSVTKVFPVRGTDVLTIDLEKSLVNSEQTEKQEEKKIKTEISEFKCMHGAANVREYDLLERKSSVDMVAPHFLNAKFLQLKKVENETNEAKFLQLKKVENETNEEYLLRMETIIIDESNEMDEMNDMQEIIKIESQNEMQEIQKEINEVKEAIDVIEKYEESISKHEQIETDLLEEQRKEDRKVKKHVSFDIIPDVVHEYGESAETTEVEETDEESKQEIKKVSIEEEKATLFKGLSQQEDTHKEYYETSIISINFYNK